MKWKRMESKFDGECAECEQEYEEGDMIWWKKHEKAICDKCGYKYAENKDRVDKNKQEQDTNKQTDITQTNSDSPPPIGSSQEESRQEAIERMHGENVAAVMCVVAKLQMIAEQISLVADKQQKRNELLYEKGKGSQ